MQKSKHFIHLYKKSSYIFEKKFQDNIGNTDR